MNLNLNKTSKYLLACSCGPDSMALFGMLLNERYNFIVCFVNYHTREQSEVEEKIIISYCNDHHIKLYIKNDSEYDVNKDGNFEAWARDYRYKFFKEIYDKEDVDATLVAHHQDDLLETYLMQKKKNLLLPYYGIKEETDLYNMRIVRPLLSFTKSDLLNYCKENNIPYSIDSTNLEDVHTRNIIRHTIIEKLTSEERNNLLKELQLLNSQRSKEYDEALKHINSDYLSIKDFKEITNENIRYFTIYEFVKRNTQIYDISKTRLQEIIKLIISNKPNLKMVLSSEYEIVKEYDYIFIRKINNEDVSYLFKLEVPGKLKTSYFEIDFTGDTSNRNIDNDDYPILIRPYKKDDIINIKGVNRLVRRLYIDWKMPLSLRSKWPVFVNKNGIIKYIPRYSKDFKLTKSSNLIVYTNETKRK